MSSEGGVEKGEEEKYIGPFGGNSNACARFFSGRESGCGCGESEHDKAREKLREARTRRFTNGGSPEDAEKRRYEGGKRDERIC